MIDVVFCDNTFCEESIYGLTQWDVGQYLRIGGLNTTNRVKVQFSLQNYEGSAVEVESTIDGEFVVVKVPQFILENPDAMGAYYSAYVFICESESNSCCKTTRKVKLIIRMRPKPEGYIHGEDDVKTFEQLAEDLRGHIDEEIEAALKDVEVVGVVVDNELSEESNNPVENKVVTREVNALRKRNAELESSIEKLQIKSTTEKAPFHHITDSANYRVLDFGMEGITEQDTVPGNQLFDFSAKANLDSSFYGLGDGGRLNILGNDGRAVTAVPITQQLEAGTYRVNMITEQCNFQIYIEETGETFKTHTGNSLTFTIPTSDIRFKIYTSTNTAQKNIECVLYRDGDGSWKPYTGGKPSPNPDYPQEIVTAGKYNEATGRYEIGFEIRQNNILNPTNIMRNKYINPNVWNVFDEPSHNVLVFDVYEAGYYGIYANYVYQINNRICAGEKLTNTFSNRQWCVFNLGVGKHMISIKHNDNTPNTGDEEYMVIKVNSADDSAPEYEEYIGRQFTLTSDRPLTKWDKLVKRDGVCGWSIWSVIHVFDGTESWVWYKDFNCVYCRITNIASDKDAKCTALLRGNILTGTGNVFDIGQGQWADSVWIRNTALSGLEEYKEWFSTNTVVIQSKSSVETFIPLPEEEQTLLNNLETYYGVTNVYNEQGCPMWLEYVNDTKLYVDKQIASAVASAQALILEN